MKTTFVTCDMCGRECGRWYEIFTTVGALYPSQNIADMLEIEGVPFCGAGVIGPKCLCKDCATVLVKAAKRMRQHSQPLQSN